MDIGMLHRAFGLVSDEFDFKLNAAQIMLIQNSVKLLQYENKLKKMYFWGRIDGIENDYFITFGHNHGLFQYFYSLNCIDWFILVLQKSSEMERAIKYCKSEFYGKPEKTSEILMFDEDNKATVVVDLTEEKRLACSIHHICKEIEVIQAEDVSNQCLELSTDLQLSLRSTTKPVKSLPAMSNIRSVLKQCHYIKSLHWPGLIFYHQPTSNSFGYVYFGNGRENLDVLFMMKTKSRTNALNFNRNDF